MISDDEIIRLKEAGRTWAEIAELIGSTRDAVRKRYSRRVKSPSFTPPPEPTFEELLSLARQTQQTLDRLDPVITHTTISLRDASPIGVIFTSCAHLGSRYVHYEAFEKILKQALDIDRLYWVSLGDDIEGFMGGFKDASAVTDQALANPLAQRRMLASVLDMLASRGKLLCGCASQHGGDWIRNKTGDDPIKALYSQRSIPFMDGKAMIHLNVGGQTYNVALAHEWPGTSMYNKNHAQRRGALFDFPSADIIVGGDKHMGAVQRITLPPFEYDAGLRPSYVQWLVQVGTSKTGNDKYSIKGWSRGVLDWPIFIFHHNEHHIEYTDSLKRADLLLRSALR